jgi:hypothetical protein
MLALPINGDVPFELKRPPQGTGLRSVFREVDEEIQGDFIVASI